jgi:glyoxalase family protein
LPIAIRGLHHYTYCGGPAQEDLDFHTRLLGLRLLKQTGLYEGEVPIYHLYYGNAEGDAGTVLTSFPMRQQGVKGSLGTDQISRLNLSIPRSAIAFWVDRLRAWGLDATTVELYGTERIHFAHPCGIPYGLVADGRGDPSRAWEQGGVAADHAILGSHGITINVSDPEAMIVYLEMGLGAAADGTNAAGGRWRLGAEPHRVGLVELVEDLESAPGTRYLGEGTVHHCAWDVADAEVQLALKRRLESLGYDKQWLGPRDRTYFVSVYNRTPGGALFEYAWSKPELWTVDEPANELGQTFKVPPMFADQMDTILDYLEPLDFGEAVAE